MSNAGAEKASFDIDPDGNIELHHVGNLTTHTEGNATINIDGDATIEIGGNLSATVGGTTDVESGGDATLTAPNVTIDSPHTTCTGTLTVQGLFSYLAGMVGTGTGPGGAGAAITGHIAIVGTATATGEITAGGIGLIGHHHTAQGAFSPTTASQA